MKKTLFAAAALVLLAARTAEASPAMPRPLERRVEDADLIVVARLRDKPAHPGDEFSVDVEETLKGRSPGTSLSAKAAYFFVGCVPPPPGTPPPASLEGRATRAILFLDTERQSRDPILLDPDGTASAWVGESRPAAHIVAAIKTLVALDAETDDARAAGLWEKGLAGENDLLTDCLLLRIGFAARTAPEWNAGELGSRITPRAHEQLVAAKAGLLPHLTRFVGAEESRRRVEALWQSYSCLYAGLFDDEPERTALIEALRTASHAEDAKSREVAVGCLAAARDPEVPERYLAALRRRPPDPAELASFSLCGGELMRRSYPGRERELLAAAAPLLDDPSTESLGVATFERLAGKVLGSAEVWREWWKTDKAK